MYAHAERAIHVSAPYVRDVNNVLLQFISTLQEPCQTYCLEPASIDSAQATAFGGLDATNNKRCNGLQLTNAATDKERQHEQKNAILGAQKFKFAQRTKVSGGSYAAGATLSVRMLHAIHARLYTQYKAE